MPCHLQLPCLSFNLASSLEVYLGFHFICQWASFYIICGAIQPLPLSLHVVVFIESCEVTLLWVTIVTNCRALTYRPTNRFSALCKSVSVRFQFLTTASMKRAVFSVVALCSLVQIYRHFRGTCCLQHQYDKCLMMEAANTSETS
jgi:hypothetical protein